MSGIAKGVGKVFQTVTDVATKVLAPVAAIGATLFTGGMAGGLPSLLAGGASALMGGITQSSSGVLPNILGGALNVMTQGAFGQNQSNLGGLTEGTSTNSGLLSSLMESSTSSSGPVDLVGSSSNLANIGGFGTAGSAALQSTVPQQTDSAQSLFDKLFNESSTTEKQGGLLSGLGSGISDYMQALENQKLLQMKIDSEQKLLDTQLQYKRDEEQRRADSYKMGAGAYIQSPYGGRVGY